MPYRYFYIKIYLHRTNQAPSLVRFPSEDLKDNLLLSFFNVCRSADDVSVHRSVLDELGLIIFNWVIKPYCEFEFGQHCIK